MPDYGINEFEEVVPYYNGRKSTNSNEYRAKTDFENQLLEEIKDIELENTVYSEKLNIALDALKFWTKVFENIVIGEHQHFEPNVFHKLNDAFIKSNQAITKLEEG